MVLEFCWTRIDHAAVPLQNKTSLGGNSIFANEFLDKERRAHLSGKWAIAFNSE
jgi:hypothetical protein